jgi:hypothetical protein
MLPIRFSDTRNGSRRTRSGPQFGCITGTRGHPVSNRSLESLGAFESRPSPLSGLFESRRSQRPENFSKRLRISPNS